MTRKMVLIVEDDDCIRETVKLALEARGYAVLDASNGDQGLALLNAHPHPNLIILDLMMPQKDGWGFLHELEEGKRTKIPIVVMSALENMGELKSHEVLKKPVDLGSLYRLVDRLCG